MNANESIDTLDTRSRREILIDATMGYLFSLAPEVTDAILRASILRWFDRETLAGVLGEGAVTGVTLPPPDAWLPAQALYDRLCALPFAQPYAERGYRLHDLTREHVLSYLWEKERDFYGTVSRIAGDYYTDCLNAQLESGSDEIDWDLGVERIYHYLVVDDQYGIYLANDFLDFLLDQYQFGTCHAVIRAVMEHAEAGRISPELVPNIDVWRIKEALTNVDVDRMADIAGGLLAADDSAVLPELKAEAAYWLAEGLRLVSRYDEAMDQFNLSFNLSSHFEGQLKAVVGAGTVEFNRENYDPALQHFANALAAYVDQVRLTPADDAELADEPPLRVFVPDAWHRREVLVSYEIEEEEALEEPGEEEGAVEQPEEDLSEFVILYFIEYDLEQLGVDAASLDDEALSLYTCPIQVDGLLASLWLNFGYVYAALDEYDIATACTRLAAQMYVDLDQPVGALRAVQWLRGLGANVGDLEQHQVLEDIQQDLLVELRVRSDPQGKLFGLINLASLHLAANRFQEAWAAYEEALALAKELNATNEQATCLDGFARLCWIRGEYEPGIARFHEALTLYEQARNREGWADTQISLGDMYLAHKQVKEAKACYTRALETYQELGTFSGWFTCLVNLSNAARAASDYDQAFTYLEQALELARSRTNARMSSQATALSSIAALHLALGHASQAEDAHAAAMTILDQIGNRQLAVSVLMDRAELLSDMADYAAAEQVYDEILDLEPDNALAHSSRGWALENQGSQRALEAAEAYRAAIQHAPDDYWIQKGLANALRLAGDDPGARAAYRQVAERIEAAGEQAFLRSTLAWCHYQLGDWDRAEALYREILRSTPDSISDWFDLGLVLLCRGAHSDATQAYYQGIDRLESHHPPRCRRGFIRVALDDLEEAAEANAGLDRADTYKRVRKSLENEWQRAS